MPNENLFILESQIKKSHGVSIIECPLFHLQKVTVLVEGFFLNLFVFFFLKILQREKKQKKRTT